MKLKESTLEYIKRRAWENMDAFIHLESDGHTPTMYPNFKHKDEYVLDGFFKVSNETGKISEYSPIMNPDEFKEMFNNKIE